MSTVNADVAPGGIPTSLLVSAPSGSAYAVAENDSPGYDDFHFHVGPIEALLKMNRPLSRTKIPRRHLGCPLLFVVSFDVCFVISTAAEKTNDLMAAELDLKY